MLPVSQERAAHHEAIFDRIRDEATREREPDPDTTK
jgi:hypothetical protein